MSEDGRKGEDEDCSIFGEWVLKTSRLLAHRLREADRPPRPGTWWSVSQNRMGVLTRVCPPVERRSPVSEAVAPGTGSRYTRNGHNGRSHVRGMKREARWFKIREKRLQNLLGRRASTAMGIKRCRDRSNRNHRSLGQCLKVCSEIAGMRRSGSREILALGPT
jgi:hypothetical protein